MLLRHVVIPHFHKGMLRKFGDLLVPLWVMDKAVHWTWGCEFPAQERAAALAVLGPTLPSLTLPECFPDFHPDTETSHTSAGSGCNTKYSLSAGVRSGLLREGISEWIVCPCWLSALLDATGRASRFLWSELREKGIFPSSLSTVILDFLLI